MKNYYFGGYSIRMEDGLNEYITEELKHFIGPTAFYDSFEILEGNEADMDSLYDEAMKSPTVWTGGLYSVHRLEDNYAFLYPETEVYPKLLFISSPDYDKIKLYISSEENIKKIVTTERTNVAIWTILSSILKRGVIYKSGIWMHAALVEKNGCGIALIGPSGTGKSTQAGLWERILDADFLNGDMVVFRKINGNWYAGGTPNDEKDQKYQQKMVPLKAVIRLKQDRENILERWSEQQAMQEMLPRYSREFTDQQLMESAVELFWQLVKEVPFYYQKNRADEEGVRLAYKVIMEKE